MRPSWQIWRLGPKVLSCSNHLAVWSTYYVASPLVYPLPSFQKQSRSSSPAQTQHALTGEHHRSSATESGLVDVDHLLRAACLTWAPLFQESQGMPSSALKPSLHLHVVRREETRYAISLASFISFSFFQTYPSLGTPGWYLACWHAIQYPPWIHLSHAATCRALHLFNQSVPSCLVAFSVGSIVPKLPDCPACLVPSRWSSQKLRVACLHHIHAGSSCRSITLMVAF